MHKVTLSYYDQDSFTIEEIVKRATQNYGKEVRVEVSPTSPIAYDHLYFGIWQLLTQEQLSILFDKGVDYNTEIKTLRQSILQKVSEIVDQVIIDNESKVN